MMTIENIKEAISLRYIELIAASNGYKTWSFYPDNGTDLSIVEVDYRIEKGQKRYYDTGRELKIQLKATTESSIVEDEYFIKYDLESKTFNDLITRKENGHPLILLLFILPSHSSEWINISDKELIAKKCAYWFFPKQTDKITTNDSSKRIEISRENIINAESITQLFNNLS